MYLQNISSTFLDYPDNSSLAVIAFFEGCSHNCKGCHNKALQTINEKDYLSVIDAYELIVNACRRNMTDKVVLSGGDPFYEKSREETFQLIDKLESSNYRVCVYTGYNIEQVEEFYNNSYRRPTFLKCGAYIESLRDAAMGKTNDTFILASKNQTFLACSPKEFQQISQGNVLTFKKDVN